MTRGNCDFMYNNVQIYNGEDNTAPLIGQYCGSRVPPTISGGSSIHVVIQDVTITFIATYSVLSSRTNCQIFRCSI